MVGKGTRIKRKETKTGWQVESGHQMSSNQETFKCSMHHLPVQSRYPTRHAKVGRTQVTPSHTGSPRLAKKGKKIDNFNSVSKSNTSKDEVELESYYSKMMFPKVQTQPAAALSASHEAVSDNHWPIREANEESNIVGGRPEESANNGNQREENLGQTLSLNLSEMLDDYSCDHNEVGSFLDPALVTVNEYRVKLELAPLLRGIFLKHGDIAKDCSLLSHTNRSSLLEGISNIVRKLQATEFICITDFELTRMLEQVRDLENVKMEVGWLRQRLDDISEAMRLFCGYSSLKDEQRRRIKAIEEKEEELKSLQERVNLVKAELVPMKTRAEEINVTISETKAKVKPFVQSLGYGLI